MCIIFFAYKSHPQYKMILAANRDEFYNRPTDIAKYWDDNTNILGGRDLKEMGTWMAINKNGRFGALTNYRDLSLYKEEALSRGNLVRKFLEGNEPIFKYLKRVQENKEAYNTFNIILGDMSSLYYYSNVENEIKELKFGIYGLSNHLLDTAWPKVERGKKKLEKVVLENGKINEERFFDILSDKWKPEDKDLPDTGVEIEWEKTLSSVFIESPNYGTRASTILLIDNNNHVTFIEKGLVDISEKRWEKSRYEFDIM